MMTSFLNSITWNGTSDSTTYPFCLPIIKHLKTIEFPNRITFFVGENGSGKSTLLEAIAYKAGFGPEGGSKNIHFTTSPDESYNKISAFADQLHCSWQLKPINGYFFRAESYFTVANYLEEMARTAGGPEKAFAPYGGKSPHVQSHGESFLAFFKHRTASNGFFIFDEPEAALSPARQLSLISLLHQLCTKSSQIQFIIATHSPLLLAYPNATIYSCDSEYLTKINYTDTDHYTITKNFLNNPELYMHYLCKD
jgi:predicted ATPase